MPQLKWVFHKKTDIKKIFQVSSTEVLSIHIHNTVNCKFWKNLYMFLLKDYKQARKSSNKKKAYVHLGMPNNYYFLHLIIVSL